MRIRAVVGVALSFSGLCVCPLADEPDRIYWVQVGSFEQGDADGPAERAADLQAAGYGPVCIYPVEGGLTVRVGEFPVYMDAFLLWEDLKETYPTARVRYNSLDEETEAGREWMFRALRAPEGPHAIFSLESRPLESAEPLRFESGGAAILTGGWLPGNRERLGGASVEAQALVLLNVTEGDTDPLRGEALYLLGDARAGQGELQRAREVLRPVANGRVAASPQSRYQAMWLMARLYHRLDWRRTAYRAFREIESICPDPLDRAQCLLEEAGLLFELAQSGSGRLCEVRTLTGRICVEFADQEDPALRKCVAAASQMAAETCFFEGDYARCLRETQRVIDEFPDVRHEWGLALQWHGDALRRLGRTAEALPLYQRNLDTPWGDVIPGSLEYIGRAITAERLAEALDELGRDAEGRDVRRRLIADWPDTGAARRAAREMAEEEQ